MTSALLLIYVGKSRIIFLNFSSGSSMFLNGDVGNWAYPYTPPTLRAANDDMNLLVVDVVAGAAGSRAVAIFLVTMYATSNPPYHRPNDPTPIGTRTGLVARRIRNALIIGIYPHEQQTPEELYNVNKEMCEKFLEEERWTDRTNENIDVALSSELTGYSDIHDNSPSEKMEEAQIVEANSGSSSGSGPSNPSPLVCNVVSTSSSTPGERISTLPQQRERVHGVLPSYIQAEFGLSVKADRFYRNQDTRRMFGFYTTPAASTAATRTTAKHPKVVHADQPYVGWTREVLVDNEGGTAVQFLAPPPPQRENHFSSSSDTSTVQHDNEDREVISTPEDLSHFTRRQVVSSSAHAPPTNCSTLLVTSFEFDELFCLCHRPEEGDYFHCDYGLAGCGSWFHSGECVQAVR